MIKDKNGVEFYYKAWFLYRRQDKTSHLGRVNKIILSDTNRMVAWIVDDYNHVIKVSMKRFNNMFIIENDDDVLSLTEFKNEYDKIKTKN